MVWHKTVISFQMLMMIMEAYWRIELDAADDGRSLVAVDDGRSLVAADYGKSLVVAGDGKSFVVADDGKSLVADWVVKMYVDA